MIRNVQLFTRSHSTSIKAAAGPQREGGREKREREKEDREVAALLSVSLGEGLFIGLISGFINTVPGIHNSFKSF